jgi:hypothetical protein
LVVFFGVARDVDVAFLAGVFAADLAGAFFAADVATGFFILLSMFAA